MEENFFKVDPETINQNRFSLSKSESKHLIKSLRSNIGDEIWLLDGLGVAYKGLISSINNNCVEGNIVNSFNNYGESKFDINLIIGLIKGKRMDLLLEKATELGVKSIQPLLLDRCIKTKLNYLLSHNFTFGFALVKLFPHKSCGIKSFRLWSIIGFIFCSNFCYGISLFCNNSAYRNNC